jgi:hypothetical protein
MDISTNGVLARFEAYMFLAGITLLVFGCPNPV